MKDDVASHNIAFLTVKHRLKQLGATGYVLSKPEVGKLALLIHSDETIEAFIYGVYSSGWGMLVATNRKLIFIDKMFLDMTVEETPYTMVSAVDHSYGHLFATITLHTRSKDYSFKRVNRKCAHKFVNFVEDKMIEAQLRAMEQEKAAEAERILNESINFHAPTNNVEQWVSN